MAESQVVLKVWPERQSIISNSYIQSFCYVTQPILTYMQKILTL